MVHLLPREEKFFELFEESAQNVLKGARMLKEMIDGGELTDEQAEKIHEVEHRGDDLTHELMARLNRTFVTPIDREDIHNMTSCLDDVLDYVEATSDRLALFAITEPTPEAKELARIIVEAAEEICKGVKGLHTLRNPEEILHRCQEINRLENEADTVSRAALGRLFRGEFTALEAIAWKDLYDHLEDATDKCEDVANVLESIVVKYS